MNANSPSSNLGLAWLLANDLQMFATGATDFQRQVALQTVFGHDITVLSRPDSTTRPAYSIISSPGVQMVAILGARTRSQVQNFYDSIVATRHPHQFDGFNTAAWDFQDYVYFHESALTDFRKPRVIFYGHSFGGCCALAMAGIGPFSQGQSVSVLTYGTPRCVRSRSASAQLGGIDITRFNHWLDSVPRFPPRADEAYIMSALQSAATLANLAQWTHVGDGLTLSQAGIPVHEELPPLYSVYTDLDLWAFLLSNDSLTAQYHRISTYTAELLYAATLNGSITPDPLGGPLHVVGTPQLEAFGTHHVNPAAAAQVAALQTTYATQSISTQRYRPYVAKKTAEGWGVFFNDQQVNWAKEKRSAKLFANALNRAFHLWWKSRFGATQTLETSVSQLFNAPTL